MISFVFPTLCLGALVGGFVAFLIASASFASARQELRDALQARGLEVTGDLDLPSRGLTMQRRDGVRAATPADLVLGGTSLVNAPSLYRCVVVSAPLPMADQVVCDRALEQPVFGAFPPAPVGTGEPHFDARFGIYPAPSPSGGYRHQGAALASWASPSVLAGLAQAGFLALNVRDGQAQIAFGATSPDGMAAAVAVSDDLRAAASGTPVPSRRAWRPVGVGGRTGAHATWLGFAAIMMLTLVISIASSSMTFQNATEPASFTLGANEVACPDGGLYSAGPGFRKQHRTHYCFQTNGTQTPANEGLLKLWTWGSAAALAAGIYFMGVAVHRSSRGSAHRRGAENLRSDPR